MRGSTAFTASHFIFFCHGYPGKNINFSYACFIILPVTLRSCIFDLICCEFLATVTRDCRLHIYDKRRDLSSCCVSLFGMNTKRSERRWKGRSFRCHAMIRSVWEGWVTHPHIWPMPDVITKEKGMKFLLLFILFFICCCIHIFILLT